MDARVVGESFSAIKSRELKEEYGCVRRTRSGWLPVLSMVLERERFLRRRQRRPKRAKIKAPPTAPTIIPTKAPVESPSFECEVDEAEIAAAPVPVGVTIIVVVVVGVDT
jgi:hypothetical protein